MTERLAIQGRRALITGASGGIGAAIARSLAQRGAEIIITGRRADVLSALADETSAEVLTADLTDRAQVTALLERAGDVDILVNNAALPGSGEITDFSPAEIDRALDVNLRAPILLARAAAQGMIRRRRGRIVFISSLAGKVAPGMSSLYSATKFGLRGFAMGLREDLRPHGVGVSVIYPGFIRDAGMFAESGATLPAGVGTRRPEDVARAVIRAIEHNHAELDVAPVGLRLGTYVGMVAPEVAATVTRRLGGGKVGASLAEGQRTKR